MVGRHVGLVRPTQQNSRRSVRRLCFTITKQDLAREVPAFFAQLMPFFLERIIRYSPMMAAKTAMLMIDDSAYSSGLTP